MVKTSEKIINNGTLKPEEKKNNLGYINGFFDKLFAVLIFVFLILLYKLTVHISVFREDLEDLYSEAFIKTNKETGYEWPKITDFWLTIAAAIATYYAEIVTKKLVWQWVYDNAKPQADENIRILKVNKAAARIFQTLYYILTTVIGFWILRKTDFLPPMLGGTGDLANLYNGYPFVDDPKYMTQFKYYYLLGLGNTVT